MICNSIEEVDLKDGEYRGRFGGKIVVVKLTVKKSTRFKVDYDMGDLSIPVLVYVKNKKAVVKNRELKDFDK